jgi:hypothetical protein
MTDPAPPGTDRTCPWCSEAAGATDITCSKCGAALAQREDLGGVLIPGLTGVDPGLAAFAAQPTHLRGPSPSQGLATGIIPAAAMGGPAGLAIIGGIAAVAALEYMSGKGSGSSPADLETLGKPSELALLARDKAARDDEVLEAPALEAPAAALDVPSPAPPSESQT